MFVSNHQIHNVLNVYSKQFRHEGNAQKLNPKNKKKLCDHINISTEAKRRATIEKVAQDILNKISHYGAKDKTQLEADHPSEEKKKNRPEFDRKQETSFVFNVIDDLNKKTTTALSVKDTNFLINRLEQLAKDAAEKDSEI